LIPQSLRAWAGDAKVAVPAHPCQRSLREEAPPWQQRKSVPSQGSTKGARVDVSPHLALQTELYASKRDPGRDNSWWSLSERRRRVVEEEASEPPTLPSTFAEPMALATSETPCRIVFAVVVATRADDDVPPPPKREEDRLATEA
jgi:hypothetical protein